MNSSENDGKWGKSWKSERYWKVRTKEKENEWRN